MSENVYQIDFNKPESVHFIGIGGISMSGLAEILMDEGFTVSGSDAHRSELTDNLEARGAKAIRKEPLERFVVDTAIKVIFSDEIVEQLIDLVMEAQQKENTRLPVLKDQLRDTLRYCKAKLHGSV